jgi:uncharacterized RDD family membrane protein YckC
MSTPPPLPAHNPYAAPLARVDEDPIGELTLADRGTRLGAALLDGVSWMIAVVPVMFLAALAPNSGGQPDDLMMGIIFSVMGACWIALLVVNLLWLHRYGQTIGKRILKIKVTRSDGTHCALSRIVFARWLPVTLLSMVPLLGYIAQLVDPLMIFREDRRCLHDLIADTIVVRA